MLSPVPITRRTFLADLGRGGFALAIVSVAACAPGAGGSSAASGPAATPPATPPPSGSPPASSSASAPPASSSAGAGSGELAWERVNLGFVSAYVLVRAGEAAIVDTGVGGSEGAIESSLDGLGLSWSNVAHVILTHKHPDHAGSIAAVLELAADATGYIGTGDLAAVTSPRPLTGLADGDRVFDLDIVGTPGHTVGHISVLDPVAGVVVAGDALGTTGGTLACSNPQFTEDPTAAKATVVKLGKLRFETLLVGHGDPIMTGASTQVVALGAAG
jgi:glyoxylase-like metal-dependent hydrolase (beta-lactamase superfamily II)